MATTAEEWLKTFRAAESDLNKAFHRKDRDPTVSEVNALLVRVRSAFENVAFASLESMASNDAEMRLWDAHVRVNDRLRKQLTKFRDEEGKKRLAEKRRLEKLYLDFIKSSMRCYRRYLRILVSHYGGILQLSEVATRLKLETTSIDDPMRPSPEARKRILDSYHVTLVRLGDLSRYRETELKGNEWNWGPATRYYELASYIKPTSGLPHNQLAVIALADGSHVQALYQLYRAQVVDVPHRLAKDNLDIEFKKIIQLKHKNEFSQRDGSAVQEWTVDAWLVYLHARYDQGEAWAEHEDMENELLSQLSILVKERPLENQLQRLSLTNIAAEYVARRRAEGDGNNTAYLSAFQFYEKLNLKTFFTLLQIFLPELASEDKPNDKLSGEYCEDLTAIARRILPSLRHYSSWLVSNAPYMVVQDKDPLLGVHIREFWNVYASALTLLAATFPTKDLPTIGYLLEEDEDTLGFIPLANENTTGRYCGSNGELKPRHGAKTVPKELPNVEMLYRVKQLLTDGIELVKCEKCAIPIELIHEDALFVYHEKDLPKVHSSPQIPSSHTHTRSAASIYRDDIERAWLTMNETGIDDEQSTRPTPTSNATTMNNIVNELVGVDTADLSPIRHRVTEPPISTKDSDSRDWLLKRPARTITAQDLGKSIQLSSAPSMERENALHPVALSIWTPMPGEVSGTPQMRPGVAHRSFKPASSITAQRPSVSPSSFFQGGLTQPQQQQIQVRPSNAKTPGLPSSWMAHQENTPFRQDHLGLQGSPWGPPISSSMPFATDLSESLADVPRRAPGIATFGVIGQVPPSGQGGRSNGVINGRTVM